MARHGKNFLLSSKAVLGAEGGASIFDFDGTVEKNQGVHVVKNPNADFEEVSKKILYPFEGNVVHQTITPRIFESIAFKNALLLLPENIVEYFSPIGITFQLPETFQTWIKSLTS